MRVAIVLFALMPVVAPLPVVAEVSRPPDRPGPGGCSPAIVVDWVAEATGRPQRPNPTSPRVRLAGGRDWCLQEDAVQARLWDWHAGRFKISNDDVGIVSVLGDDVSFDLRGHRIENRWYPNGGALLFLFGPDSTYEEGFVIRRTTIRNGRMISPGRSGVAIDLVATGPRGLRNVGRTDEARAGRVSPTAFAPTAHRIENMTLGAGRHAILIDGRDNVIRGNRIVVEGSTAIVATGPGVVIEDNDIDVRATQRSLDLGEDPPFPVRLLHADGARVRNNRIRYTGGAAGRPPRAAVELTRSRDVVVDGNVLVGIDRSVEPDADSSARTSATR